MALMMRVRHGVENKGNMVCCLYLLPSEPPTTPFVVCHAELNTIIAGFRRCVDLSKCALYVNYSPCVECSKLVIQSGIKKVVYARHYRKKKHETYDHLVELRDMKIT